ncbi:hypothetical protein HPB50_029195 [Hyalomma asiaticum]|nr:hypothetical protein HPB50_029195 [Hyalomma asiaticum]
MEGKNDFWMGLLSYRSSPLEDGRSPAELLQGRHLRTPIPDFNEGPRTAVRKHGQAQPRRRSLPPLTTGQVVQVQGNTWETKAKVLIRMQPRSYSVITEKGNVMRSNRQHLLPTAESFDDTEDSSDEESTSDDVVNHPRSTTDSAISVTVSPGLRRSA